MEHTVYEIFGKEIEDMTTALLERAGVAEKLPKSGLIGLKPNLVVPKPPEEGATTHTEILRAVIRFVQANSQAEVAILEGAWVGASTQEGFRACGYDRLAREYGVQLVDLKKDQTKTVETAIGKMEICRTPLEADYLINLPVLKGHCQTVMTCALKNCKGCLPDREKRRFHALGLHRPIAALAAVLRPDLTIADSICGDLNFEEGGTPVQTDRLLLSEDMVRLDAYGCSLLGVPLSDVPYIGLAERNGAGSTSLGEIVSLNSPEPGAREICTSGIVRKLTGNVVQKSACSACFGNLVHALYRLQESGAEYRGPISVGQEFRGKSCRGVGIGACCRGAAEGFVPGCPASAEEIAAFLRRNARNN